MLLDLRQRHDLWHGVAGWLSVSEEWSEPLRLTRLYEYDNLYMQSCCAGVRLVFTTNSSFFCLNSIIKSPGYISHQGIIDVVVNSSHLKSYYVDEKVNKPQNLNISFELPTDNQTNDVEIYFPSQRGVRINYLEIDDDSVCNARYYSSKPWLFLGDSITQGFYGTPARTWVSRLARHYHKDFDNLGVGGAVVSPNYAMWPQSKDYEKIFLAYGVNDCNQKVKLSDFELNFQKLLVGLRNRFFQSQIIITTPLHWPLGYLGGKREILSEYRKCIKNVCAKNNCLLINGEELIPEDKKYFEDGCHPNMLGMNKIALKLISILDSEN